MADQADLQSTFSNGFFRTACTDVLRIVSILSLDSSDVTRPKEKQSALTNFYEKSIFFYRFIYMVFFKGFTPTIFDILPYTIWTVITILIYVYRLIVIPYWLRFTGYGKYASWKDLGSQHPDSNSPVAETYNNLVLSKTDRLSSTNFGDPKYEFFLSKLHSLSAHLSPHSQSPGNPFTHSGFPGNFFDHLTGVYKILLAWKQPQYMLRAGLFHSVYGTFDYRHGLFDLSAGRQPLQDLIGNGAEEIAFALCTSDRIGLIRDLMKSMYGDNAKASLQNKSNCSNAEEDGNPYPELTGELSSMGYPVRNHITQEVHVLPPEFFAAFILVTIADFMEQGAIGFGSADMDICLFQFLRYRFYNDLILFVSPYLRSMPLAWQRLGRQPFKEPLRQEVIQMKSIWTYLLHDYMKRSSSRAAAGYVCVLPDAAADAQQLMLLGMVNKYPYLPEPRIALAATLAAGQSMQGHSRASLAKEGLQLLEEWGMLTIKSGGVHGMKVVLELVSSLLA